MKNDEGFKEIKTGTKSNLLQIFKKIREKIRKISREKIMQKIYTFLSWGNLPSDRYNWILQDTI